MPVAAPSAKRLEPVVELKRTADRLGEILDQAHKLTAGAQVLADHDHLMSLVAEIKDGGGLEGDQLAEIEHKVRVLHSSMLEVDSHGIEIAAWSAHELAGHADGATMKLGDA